MDNQIQLVIDYTLRNPGTTVRDIFTTLNVNSPTSVYSKIRRLVGYNLATVWDSRTNKAGEKKRFVRYFLEEVA